MPHEPNLEKRARFQRLEANLKPLFATYDGSRDTFIAILARKTGLSTEAVWRSIGYLLDKWGTGDEEDRTIARHYGPVKLAEDAIWGNIGDYKED